VLTVVYLVTDRPDHALHEKARLFALAFVIVFVAVPTLIWLARRDGALAAWSPSRSPPSRSPRSGSAIRSSATT